MSVKPDLRGSANGNRWSPTGTEILTRSGQMVDLLDPQPEQIRILDIATGLARQERFAGHCLLRPTVAQHSLAVAYIAAMLWRRTASARAASAEPDGLGRAALMHDAAEYLIGDISGAVKMLLRAELRGAAARNSTRTRAHDSAFDKLETRVQDVIVERFGCSVVGWEDIIHEADKIACAYEMSFNGWCSDAVPPDWAANSRTLRFCYQTSDGGETDFVWQTNSLGMSDA